MLHGSTGKASAAAPVSELPMPVAVAPANSTPRPRSARRSTRPLPATSGRRDATLSCLVVMESSLEAFVTARTSSSRQVLAYHVWYPRARWRRAGGAAQEVLD